jgi:hypothetical protein
VQPLQPSSPSARCRRKTAALPSAETAARRSSTRMLLPPTRSSASSPGVSFTLAAPMLVVFLCFQRQLVAGLTLGRDARLTPPSARSAVHELVRLSAGPCQRAVDVRSGLAAAPQRWTRAGPRGTRRGSATVRPCRRAAGTRPGRTRRPGSPAQDVPVHEVRRPRPPDHASPSGSAPRDLAVTKHPMLSSAGSTNSHGSTTTGLAIGSRAEFANDP